MHLPFTGSLLAGLVLGVVMATGCATEGTTDRTSRVEVTDLQYRKLPGGARIVTGSLRNLSRERISGAQVQVSLFDADNRRISSMSIVVQDIPAGTAKSFRAPVDVNLDIQGARVRSVLIM